MVFSRCFYKPTKNMYPINIKLYYKNSSFIISETHFINQLSNHYLILSKDHFLINKNRQHLMNPQQHTKYQEVSIDNSECTCFETPLHNHRYFLSKYFSPLPLNNHSFLPQNFQTKDIALPIKRSIRRRNSPSLILNQQNKQNSISYTSLSIGENKNKNQTNIHQDQKTSKQFVNQNSISIITFQAFPSNELKKKVSQPIKVQPHPNMVRINSQRSLQVPILSIPQITPSVSTKIVFNIKSPQVKQLPAIQKNETNLYSIQNHIIPIESFILSQQKDEKTKVSLKTIKQTLHIPQNLINKNKSQKETNEKAYQTPIKNLKSEKQLRILNQKTQNQNAQIAIQIHEPLLLGRGTKKDLLATATESKNEVQLSLLSNRGSEPNFENINKKKQIAKSIINTKKSLMSDKNKYKVLKKQKSKPVLSKMADVAQIHSLADQNEVMSDQESVVLGRLNQYGSMVIPRTDTAPPALQKNYTQSSSSSIVINNIRKSSQLFRQFENQ